MLTNEQLEESIAFLSTVVNKLNSIDYENIFGKQMGNHIWNQEGTDLLRLWKSGITLDERKKLVDYMLEQYT